MILRSTKALFGRLNTREKTLLTLVLWGLLIFWFSTSLQSIKTVSEQWSTVNEILTVQQVTLEKSDTVEAQLSASREHLDPNKTFSAAELAAKIDTIAKFNKLNYSVRTPKTRPNGLIDLHTINVSFKNASIEKLISFDQQIKKESPYLALEKVNIKANKDPAFLDAIFVINAFELRETSKL